MTTNDGSKRKTPSAKPNEKAVDALEKVRAEAKAALTRVKEEQRAKRKAESALAKVSEALTSVRTEIEQERQMRLGIESALTEAQMTLTALQSELQHERQALSEAKQELDEAKRALKVAGAAQATESIDLPSAALGNGSAEQRVSFIVRLTVDKNGQPLRTEVEHAQSQKKILFPALDIQRLDTFMKEHIQAPILPAAASLTAPSRSLTEAPPPQPTIPGSALRISNVRISHDEVADVTNLPLSPGADFEVQVRFQLLESLPHRTTEQASSFEVRVFAHAVGGGTSRLLATRNLAPLEDVVEYTANLQAPGLPPGIYRLVSLVALHGPRKILAHVEGPIIQIAERQQAINAGDRIRMAS